MTPFALLILSAAPPVPTPALELLRVQEAGGHLYFQARFASVEESGLRSERPRLVSQDGAARLVCAGDGEMHFLGRCTKKRGTFLLMVQSRGGFGLGPWKERTVAIDFAKAERVPSRTKKRIANEPDLDDLEGLWAVAWRDELMGHKTGYSLFAARSVARRFGVHPPPHFFGPEPMKDEKRTIPLHRIPGPESKGIEWDRLRAGRKPGPEPLADAVPHDNWYLSFKRLDRLAEIAAFAEGWMPKRVGELVAALAKAAPAASAAFTGSSLEGMTLIVRADKEAKLPEPTAKAGGLLLWSDSPAELSRVLDAIAGKTKRLSGEADFRYERSILRADNKDEEGFAFFCEAHTMRMNGPEPWIGKRRWRERAFAALLELHETGNPQPLLDEPLGKVAPSEAEDYGRFRESLKFGRRADAWPTRLRLTRKEGETKLDARFSELPFHDPFVFSLLEENIGDATAALPVRVSPKTILQLTATLRGGLGRHLLPGGLPDFVRMVADPLGRRVRLRVDDSDLYARLAEDGGYLRHHGSLPVSCSIEVRDKLSLAAVLAAARLGALREYEWDPLEKPYKGVPLVRVRSRCAVEERGVTVRPTYFYALIGDALHLALNEETIRTLIDESSSKERKTVEAGVSLYAAPGAAVKARALVESLVEAHIHKKALDAEPLWHALYSAGAISSGSDPDEAARRWFGSVPISPDGSRWRWDARRGEAVNDRHGNRRAPKKHPAPRPGSAAAKLLQSIHSIRTDLRFGEDGIHAVLTWRNKP